ncbi:hypothetical protein ABTO79_19260, partial [Acinetobacter baumannii]
LALKLVLRLFSRDGLRSIGDHIEALPRDRWTYRVRSFVDQFDRYQLTISAAIAFLQNRDPTVEHRICSRQFLPEGPRFETLEVY